MVANAVAIEVAIVATHFKTSITIFFFINIILLTSYILHHTSYIFHLPSSIVQGLPEGIIG